MTRFPRFVRSWLWLLVALALAASACGGGDSDGGETVVAATETPSATDDGAGQDDDAAGGDGASEGQGDAGDDDASSDTGGDDTAPSDGESQPTTPPDDAPDEAIGPEPVYGGTLVYGLEAETTNGLNPITAQAGASGHTVFRQIYETLTIPHADGTARPFLLESIVPNEDHTEWTLTMRPGIVFHDGLPADSAALKRHFEEVEAGTLTGIAYADWEPQDIVVLDELSIKLVLGRPVTTLPNFLMSHAGYLASPAMYDMGGDSARNPIGSGPFMLDEWIPNEVTRLVRNPDYWRTDTEGRALPYLDAIEFRVIPDTDARFAALRAGDLHASMDDAGINLGDYMEDFKVVREGEQFRSVGYLMFNASRPPFNNVEVRRALAQCTDVQTYNTLMWDGQPPATGPFSPGTPGYLEDSGFPAYDPDAGRATLEQLGITSVQSDTVATETFLRSSELVAAMWSECGIDVTINTVDQAELVTNAILGVFTSTAWRGHSGYDLTTERTWWHSKFGRGLPALNFGRINDERIDQALDQALEATSPEEHKRLAEEVNRAFADGVYNIWFYHSNRLVAAQDDVYGIDTVSKYTDGGYLPVFGGRVSLAETWING